jgi:hypothetical protein
MQTSTKHWDSSIWKQFFPVLLDHGYHLIIRDAPLYAQQDSDKQLAAASEHLTPVSTALAKNTERLAKTSRSQYDCLRLAIDLSDESSILYVKALIPSDDSQEIAILEGLNENGARMDHGNHTIRENHRINSLFLEVYLNMCFCHS